MSTFKYSLTGSTHVVTAASGVQMFMLVRKKKELFTDFIASEVAAKNLKLVINGSFIDLALGTKLAVYSTTGAFDPGVSKPTGQVIQDGKLLAGTSSTGKFNFSQDTCGPQRFSASPGNPPSSACAAVGGIAPIVIDGMPYGAQNGYKAGVPAGAPPTGDVGKAYLPYLTQKSNAMFSALLSGGKEVGKTAIGYSNASQALTVVVQQDGSPGTDANGIRTLMVSAGVDNAVFLDCSDSATLYSGGRFMVRPGTNKNEYLTVAIGFK